MLYDDVSFLLPDVRCEINPSHGYIFVKGKANPQSILLKLNRGRKHATIEWISYGLRDQDPYQQFQDPANFYNYNFMSHDPYSQYSRYPYDTSYNPYSYDMAQGALPYGDNHVHEYDPSGHCEGRNSGQLHNSHCSVHSQHHNTPESSQSGGISQMRNRSPPSFDPQENNSQANNQPAPKKSAIRSIKRIIGKCLCFIN